MAPSNRFKLDLPLEVRRFTNAEMQAATRQMSKSLMLGMGGFGPVFRLVDKEEGKCAKVGISIASKKDAGVGQGKEEFSNEAKLLYLWQHGRIVSLMGICEGPVPCIIYEHMSRGSLHALMSSDEAAAGFSASKRIQAAIDVADALDFLHTGGLGPEPPNPRVAHAVVLHRDLNPSNILLNSDYRAKVGDFGLSAMLHENDVQPDVVFSCEQVVGQWAWSAPEAQTAGNMPASDVYALGLIGLHLVFACKDASACRQSFIRGSAEGSMVPDKRLAEGSEWMEMSVEPLVDFCLQATREEPGTRPTARECLSMLSIIYEMSTGAQPAPYGPVVASDAAADRHVPVPLAQRRASPAGEAAPGGSSASAGDPSAVAGSAGSLQRIGHLAPMSHHAPSAGSQAAVESVVAVACCSEDVAREALELSGGDVNRAVDVLVSGRLEELRAGRSLATQSRGRNQNHGAGQSSSQEGGRTEPGKVYLPSGIGTGSGTVNFTDGSKYEGQWVNGECNGQGVYTNAKGMYRGQFKSGLMHGTGYHVWRDSGMEYEGEWYKGQMHGKGVLTKSGPPRQRFQIESRHGALKSQKLIPGTGGGVAAGGSRMEPNQEEKDFMKESFVAVAACSGEEALSALHGACWDLQAAIKAFLSGDPGRILFDGLPVAAGGGGDRAEQAREQGAAARDQARDRATEGHNGEGSGHVAAGGGHVAAGGGHVAAGGGHVAAGGQERLSLRGDSDGASSGGGGLAAGGGNSRGDGEHVHLPDGWERRCDASSSRFYYANQATRTTQWDMPTAAATAQPPHAEQRPVGGATNSFNASNHGGQQGAAGADGCPVELPGGRGMPATLEELLHSLSLGRLVATLEEQEVKDIETVSELEESDFSEMGVAAADAQLLMKATRAIRL